jgi:hypothetical protein
VATKEAAGPQAPVVGERHDQPLSEPVEIPTVIERAARREAARNNAADSKLSDVSSFCIGW